MSTNNWLTHTNAPTYGISTSSDIYLGIDFGTSTTVISQAQFLNKDVELSTLAICQPKAEAGFIKHHLINSVLAFTPERKLIWGQDAYRLKSFDKMEEGVRVFSSFKMRLGLAIGPTYPKTVLTEGRKSTITVETAEDATREFFKNVLQEVANELKVEDPDRYKFTFTVPASFEANQRRALIRSLESNNIKQQQLSLIDEPNAAFLSFLYECTQNNRKHSFLSKITQENANILVYDFGAGTCDISILEVSLIDNKLKSTNLAISRFTALGGDDIDRAIAKNILIPQILKSCPNFVPELRDIEETLLPKLQPIAEKLKIAVIGWLFENRVDSFNELKQYSDLVFEDNSSITTTIRKEYDLQLHSPKLQMNEFRAIMEDFVGEYDGQHTPLHVVSPILDALDKSGLHQDDLDGILFIGGSSQNPLVQSCVIEYVTQNGGAIEAIIPNDLRSHVSLGAAIHSISHYGLGVDFIQPITSESIFIITKGDHLETVIPASTPVPNPNAFKTTLIVAKDEQYLIELPICVGNRNKLLGVVTIESGDEPFNQGDHVEVTASINDEKLLNIVATIKGESITSNILNPLANEELTEEQTILLKAKQQFNQDLLDYKGRPRIHVARAYTDAALEAGAYELAADTYVGLERLDENLDFSTTICYAYSRAGRDKKSTEWSRIAYKRKPNAVNAFNLSNEYFGDEREHYLRKSLEHDPFFIPTLRALGRILCQREDPEGQELLERAQSSLVSDLRDGWISEQECEELINIADFLDNDEILHEARSTLDGLRKENANKAYEDENLVQSLKPELTMLRDK